MKYFFAKLHPPRPDFVRTMTPDELALMREHAGYLRGYAAKRWAVAFGPVADPEATFGVCLWDVPDDVDLTEICNADPVIRSGRGFRYEIQPMPNLVARG